MADETQDSLDSALEGKPFELVLVSGKGYGLFATEDIIRGTRIIEETPIVVARPDEEPGLLPETLAHLPPDKAAIIDDLYCAPSALQTKGLAQLRKDAASIPRGPQNESALAKAIADMKITIKRMAIFDTNSIRMGDKGQYGVGLFALFSRLNHSCNPNLHSCYNATIGKETVQAVRQINKGEELTISYMPMAYRTREQRAEMLKEHSGFVCKCRVCEGPRAANSEERRQKLFDLDQGLAFYERGLPPLPGLNVPTTAQQALAMCEKMVYLLKEDNLTDFALAHTYRECARNSLKAGNLDKAIAYAKKELDVERYCVGTETAHLQEDMNGAEYWLAHLETEREQKRTQGEGKGKAPQTADAVQDTAGEGKKKKKRGKARKNKK